MKKVKKAVLIVDATDNMRTAMARMLADMNFSEIYQAINIKEAQRFLSDKHVDLIISDWLLPDESGKELLLQVRENPATEMIPFVVCSAMADQLTVIDAIKAGVSEFLAKPFSYKMFKGRIERAFSKPLNERFAHKIDELTQKSEKLANHAANHPINIQPVNNDSDQLETKYTILIVDDEANNIEVANQCIKQFAKVKFALNGKRAIEVCKKSPPDLVLLDIMMPDMDGYQVLETFQQTPSLSDIPIIFLTAKTQPQDIAKGLKMGAVDYVTKPISFPVLEMRVKNQLKVLEHIRLLDSNLSQIIDEFEQRENIERILLNYIHHPLAKMGESIERIRKRGLTSNQISTEVDTLFHSRQAMERVFLTISASLRLEDKSYSPDLVPLNLYSLVNNVIQSLQRDQYSRSLQVDNFISHSTQVMGDEVLLSTMFTALHLNAIEAAPRGAKVSFFESLSNPRYIEITLFNPGPVPSEIRDTFFNKYVSKGKVNGIGLGTYAAKLVCDTHGGVIALDARENETRVIIKLPKV